MSTISREKKKATSIISSLPEEIQEQVILRMAVKSIFTCKCVCKLWYNLISSSKSIRHHLKVTGTNTNLTSFIFMSKSSLCYVEYDFEKNDEQFCEKPIEELFNLRSLFGCEEKIVIVGSCNGLVCLTTKINSYVCGHAYVCNPITQECMQLPSPVLNNKDYIDAGYCCIFYGFGYLPSSNEYKVVRISYKLASRKLVRSPGEVHVYTLGNDMEWRLRGGIEPDSLFGPTCLNIFVNGALHWIKGGKRNIFVFDLTDEKFYMHPLPPRLPSEWGYKRMLVLDGQLCIFQATTYERSNIWLLKEKMDDNSNVREQNGEDKYSSWMWSKESTVTMEDINKYRPLTITKNGDILLLYTVEWKQREIAIHYDPKTSCSKELGDLGFPLPSDKKATIHINSYISLKSLGKATALARL